MVILCQTATGRRFGQQKSKIIADGYFVSNRNEKYYIKNIKRIIADGYFVSNRNYLCDFSPDLIIIADYLPISYNFWNIKYKKSQATSSILYTKKTFESYFSCI